MIRYVLLIFFVFITSVDVFGQSKPPISFDDFDSWARLKNQRISENGQWILYTVDPYKGDDIVYIKNPKTKKSFQINRAKQTVFSANSKFVVAKVSPEYDSIRKLKIDKVPKKKHPKDSLYIVMLETGKIHKFSKVEKYAIPKEEKDFVLIYFEHESKKDSSKNEDKKIKQKKTGLLKLFYPDQNLSYDFDLVLDFELTENGNFIAISKISSDSIPKTELLVFNTENSLRKVIYAAKDAEIKNLVSDKAGKQLSFIASTDTTEMKSYDLLYWNDSQDSAKTVKIDLKQKNWTASEYGHNLFSEDGGKLFFGVAPTPINPPKDSIPDDEKVILDVWNWQDNKIQPQQKAELKDEKERTYLAVYFPINQKVIQLANPGMESVETTQKGNAKWALGISSEKYFKNASWELPNRKDYYLVDTETGKATLFQKYTQNGLNLSPQGKYIYWYAYTDSSWRAYSIEQNVTHELTKGLDAVFYDEENDYPNHPSSYGAACWDKNDDNLYIYDRYDIWQLDPLLKKKPIIVTNGYGKKKQITFRFLRLDKEKNYIDSKKEQLLSYFNNITKTSGFARVAFNKESDPTTLTSGNFKYKSLIKSKNADFVVWQRENLQTAPDLWYSNLDFKTPQKLSAINPQQDKYNWATVELVNWVTTDGLEEEGLLYKPEDFDPSKKYPMVVYFYRLSTDRMYSYMYPKPSRSVINPLSYASKGYLVFIPNIRYKIGYPGESAYNYVVSGTLEMIRRPYVDKNNIGIQGQSWGGYQVAYIVTKTDLFKAASSGAPVSNMTSAYGGIRWKSGYSRMFQYEQTQSRIGGTLWEMPMQYIENSPVFYVPKINTPLLIRHDDADGAVPWYQGIELFMAMRRLNKPAWLLNYNGEPHNLRDKSPATKDFSIRQLQFFDHYLKGAAAPVWMTKGLPAINKGKELGYELDQ